MVKISKRIAQVGESQTLATSAKVKQLKAEGKDIISLTVGEPDFDTPAYVKEAVISAIQGNLVNHYTPAAGILPLRQAIIDFYQKNEGIDYSLNQVIVTEGAKNALYSLFQVILDPGDEVIIPAPFWVSYTEQVKLAGGKNIIINSKQENEFKLTVEELEKGRTDKTVALIINSPNNPTGSIYSKEELKEIGDWAIKHDILIVADEIYAKLCYNGNEAVSIASISEDIKNQTIIINGVSKTYAMTGWRIGYALGNEEIIGKMIILANHSTSNPAHVSQHAALAAIGDEQGFISNMQETFERRLNHVYPLLETIPGFNLTKPKGAFYVFADVKEAARQTGYETVADFALAMIEEAGVAVVSGDGFGYPGHIRISYTQEEAVLTEAVNRIKSFIEKKTRE